MNGASTHSHFHFLILARCEGTDHVDWDASHQKYICASMRRAARSGSRRLALH